MTIPYDQTLAAMTDDHGPLAFPLGVAGDTLKVVDLAKAPHILFAGTTGSGKSVGLNVAISTMLQRAPGTEFVMIDPKRVELSLYRDTLGVRSVTTDMDDAAEVIEALCEEMMERYEALEAAGARNVEELEAKTGEVLHPVVLVVDELSDLMDTNKDQVLGPLSRLAQLGRAAAFHMMLATQRPAADTIPKKLLANVPTRVAYLSQSHTESRLILGEKGAEDLKGKGDLLALIPGVKGLTRAQGPFISDEEIAEIVGARQDTSAQDIVDEAVEETEDDFVDIDDFDYDEVDQPSTAEPAAAADGAVADALGRILAAQYDERVQRLEDKIAEAEREIASLEADADMNRNIHRKAVAELEAEIREKDAVIEGLTAERHEHAANAATAWEMAEAATERATQADRVALKVKELGSSGGWAVTLTLLITFIVGGTAGAAFGVGASFAALALGGFIATMISTTTTTKQKEMIDSWNSRKSTHSTS